MHWWDTLWHTVRWWKNSANIGEPWYPLHRDKAMQECKYPSYKNDWHTPCSVNSRCQCSHRSDMPPESETAAGRLTIINLTDSLTDRHQHPEASAQMIDTCAFCCWQLFTHRVSRRRSFGISYNIYHTYKVTNRGVDLSQQFMSRKRDLVNKEWAGT